MPLLKISLVGRGEISQHHLYAIQQLQTEIKITAVIDPIRKKSEAISVKTGAHIFLSFDDDVTTNTLRK